MTGGFSWNLIADVRNTGRFSPEVLEAEWLDGATGPALGARFRGHVKRNEIGPVYWTTCRVTACEPGCGGRRPGDRLPHGRVRRGDLCFLRPILATGQRDHQGHSGDRENWLPAHVPHPLFPSSLPRRQPVRRPRHDAVPRDAGRDAKLVGAPLRRVALPTITDHGHGHFRRRFPHQRSGRTPHRKPLCWSSGPYHTSALSPYP